ncbi:VOC family protein [Arsenicibacter rosenii]|uniref:Bleomycin resistance protein n=1 Tax=Arsenicibacter rosenii TaxID=1750698 RepID=A0A1S2VCU7_9BACT|nr:VOC family protein [Arsenicibacter rosenii]OIN56561.1 bleomycin resistance protein [Arsenicibacter rosenii]
MSGFLGLRTTIYAAPDLTAAKAWYTQVLGIAPYFDEPFYVGFSVGGFELGLDPDLTPGIGTPVAYWGVSEIDEMYNRLLELGATVQEPVQDVGGGIKVAVVRDPMGNLLGIIENPHFRIG